MNDYAVLVNKENLLSKDYVPSNLIITDNNENNFHNYKNPSLKPMIREDIYPYIVKMLKDARKHGYNIIVDSGYRSYEYQRVVYDSLIKEKGSDALNLVAMPGASEHQTGLAIDIAYMNNGVYSDNVNEFDEEVLWMMDNAYKYGFILRYPALKESITGYSFEPWHYRFVGLDLAKYLYDNNFTLEEYYLLENKKTHLL